jgi:hypothetical protein
VIHFRFDVEAHTYTELGTGYVFPHVTGMLTRTGWVDDTWMTEESCERGQIVHTLTADFDLGAIENPHTVTSAHKGYLLAHVALMQALGVTVLAVEEPIVCPVHRFGVRPDRVDDDAGLVGPFEIKSGEEAKSHPIQTALQAIALEHKLQVPAELQQRLCAYLKPNGRYKLREHRDPADFTRAREILRACAG